MARYSARLLDAFDIFDRFEYKSSNDLTGSALAAIGRLKDEGSQHFNPGQEQLERWEKGCHELWHLINDLGSIRDTRRHAAENRGEDFDLRSELLGVFGDFVDRFEHIELRIHQELYSDEMKSDQKLAIDGAWFWLNVVYRFATYAIVATSIEGKQDVITATIQRSLSAGETTEECTHSPMRFPRNFLRRQRRRREQSGE